MKSENLGKWLHKLTLEERQFAKELSMRALRARRQGALLWPPQDKIFRALEVTAPEDVRVCIIGQDPYHTPGAANGLAFSVANNSRPQPSLTNIFKELELDLQIPPPANTDLIGWAKQGVLLLNTILTVYEKEPNSCKSWGWEAFTQTIMQLIHDSAQPVVFMCWGQSAQRLAKKLFTSPVIYEEDGKIGLEKMCNAAYIFSSHPSPLSVTRKCDNSPSFRGSRPFSTANQLLVNMGAEPIDWRL